MSIKKSANNIIFFIPVVLFFFVLLFFSLRFNKSENLYYEEVIIPQIKIPDGGIQKNYNNNKDVSYFNKNYSKSKSEIQITNDIKLNQKAKRYLFIRGKVKPKKDKFENNFYRSVIIELDSKKKEKEYFFFPIDESNNFSGYIYFKTKSKYKVFLFLFIDYMKSVKDLGIPDNIQTTASCGFHVDVLDAVPEDFYYLLPTKNVNCANKYLRDFTAELVQDCNTNFEKAKKIYEYLALGNDKDTKFFYKEYNENFVSCREVNYHNAFIASQIFIKRNGVCNDFAEVYAAMLRSQGIKVKKIWGYADRKKEAGHMWNLVDITGDEKKWLLVDPTWGNANRNNYKKWAEFYPEFDLDYFNTSFNPFNHNSFRFELKIEY